MKRFIVVFAVVALSVMGLAACGQGKSAQNKAISLEQKQQGIDTYNLDTNQPVPGFNYSQIRQNLKEIETAQANGVQTTSVFYNLGSNKPVYSCPSIGAPIPTTDQLTNPVQAQKDNIAPLNNGGGNVVVGQEDPNGVYSGQSTGTYVICVLPNGKAEATYWEGYVGTWFGPATVSADGTVTPTGVPTGSFSSSKATSSAK
jgi:hypothetical protein